FFSSRRRHTRSKRDWSSDVCSSDLLYSNFFRTSHGFPKASTLSGISLVTTHPAPMVTLFPMVTPGKIIEFPPIQTLSPIVTGWRSEERRVGKGCRVEGGWAASMKKD